MAYAQLKPIANDPSPAHDFGEITIERLPAIIRKAVRRQVWAPEGAETVRDIAIKIQQHSMAGYETAILMPVLAQAITRCPPMHVPLEGFEEELQNLAWAMLAVPAAWNNPVLRAMPSTQSLDDLHLAVEVHIAGAERIRRMNTGDVALTHARIAQLVEEAKIAYPDLGLSFGYIGGCHTWGDDRSYRVFAKLATQGCHGACDISFGGFAHDKLGDMLAVMERDFAGWLAATAKRLADADIRIVR